MEQAGSALSPAGGAQMPPKGKAAAEKGLHLGYGATFGAPYGLTAGDGSPWLPGAVLAGPIATHVG